MLEITATELKAALDAGADIQLIDVRQPDEFAFAKIEGAKLIPLGEIIARMGELDPTRETVVHCKMGGRSPIHRGSTALWLYRKYEKSCGRHHCGQ